MIFRILLFFSIFLIIKKIIVKKLSKEILKRIDELVKEQG